jgi:hypothetical protein
LTKETTTILRRTTISRDTPNSNSALIRTSIFIFKKCNMNSVLVLHKNKHSHTDEGMTRGSLILAYLVFGPGRTSIERIARPTSIIVWRGPEARLGVQGKA